MSLRVRVLAALAILILAGCGTTPEPAPAPPRAIAPKKMKDHQAVLMQENQVASRMVADHLLDHPKLPGGSLGEYQKKGKKYQIFVIDVDSNQAAALLLFDYKGSLQNPDYISYMGGYFGSDGKQPVYIFAKKQYVAGIAGLSMAEADPLARTLASRLQ